MKFLILPLVLFFSWHLPAQLDIDSLYHELKQSKTDTARIDLLIELGHSYEKKSLDSTISFYNRAISLSEAANDSSRLSTVVHNIGGIYMRKGAYDRSNEAYYRAIHIHEKRGESIDLAGAYSGLGVNYQQMGQLDKATNYFEKSIALSRSLGAENTLNMVYHNLGLVHIQLGLYDKANIYLDSSIYYHKKEEKWNEVGDLYNDKGIVSYYQQDYNQALDWYRKSLEYHLKGNDRWGASNNYMNIGIINVFQTNADTNTIADKIYFYELSIDNFNKCREIKKSLGDIGGVANNDVNLAALYLDMASLHDKNEKVYLDSCIQIADRAIRVSKQLNVIPNIKLATYSKSKAYWALKDYTNAKKMANRLISYHRKDLQINFSFISEKEKELYFNKHGEDFMYLNSLALNIKDSLPYITIDVYNNSIQNKGMLLKSSTAMKNIILTSDDPTLIKEYESWITVKQQIAQMYAIQQSQRKFNLDSLDQVANSMERELVKKSSDFKSFSASKNVDYVAVRNQLKENEAAIEFVKFYYYDGVETFEYKDSIIYCALIVTPELAYPEMIPLFEEKELVQLLGGSSNSNTVNSISEIYGTRGDLNGKLYDLIWQPIESYVNEYEDIIVSPVGHLHKISFPAIGVDKKIYLSDVYNIQLSPNTGQIAGETRPEATLDKFAIFGGIKYNETEGNEMWSYLDGTEKEAHEIQDILSKASEEVKLFSQLNASEKQFKDIATESNVLHIATHGFFYPNPEEVDISTETTIGDINFRGGGRGVAVQKFVQNPNPLMRSGIVFAKANDVWNSDTLHLDDDGVLTAQEVAHIDMRNASLVVLSACETALGDIKGSEGVYGLQRAFKMAGVDQLIMSLWKVPDKETAEFMTFFYRKLTAGKSIREAFSETQQYFSKRYDPYYWAAFVLLN